MSEFVGEVKITAEGIADLELIKKTFGYDNLSCAASMAQETLCAIIKGERQRHKVTLEDPDGNELYRLEVWRVKP